MENLSNLWFPSIIQSIHFVSHLIVHLNCHFPTLSLTYLPVIGRPTVDKLAPNFYYNHYRLSWMLKECFPKLHYNGALKVILMVFVLGSIFVYIVYTAKTKLNTKNCIKYMMVFAIFFNYFVYKKQNKRRNNQNSRKKKCV